jgi:allantoicase
MKILYHGSLTIIDNPKIILSNRTLDFGEGFYTTSSKKQAAQWIKIRLLGKDITQGILNSYYFDETALTSTNIKTLHFQKPDEAWVDFVMKNRLNRNFQHSYDIVIGPVANDRVYACFNAFENGFMNKQTLISELKTYRLIDQYLFHTEKALQYLQYINSQKI